jgi:MerR family transcriptional regulator, copper efflux regulator
VHLKDLIERTGTTERQIRYLIAEGFVPPPRGGRAHADYGEDHVDAVTRYARLKELGFPPAAIKLLLSATAGIPFPLARGVTLVVDTSQIASGAAVAPVVEQAREILSKLFNQSVDRDPPGGASV